jgi:hypothetical protein
VRILDPFLLRKDHSPPQNTPEVKVQAVIFFMNILESFGVFGYGNYARVEPNLEFTNLDQNARAGTKHIPITRHVY